MNADVLSGKWMQLKGEIKRKWGKLTDNELDQINGNHDKLVGKLQERYGHTRDIVNRDLDQLLTASKSAVVETKPVA